MLRLVLQQQVDVRYSDDQQKRIFTSARNNVQSPFPLHTSIPSPVISLSMIKSRSAIEMSARAQRSLRRQAKIEVDPKETTYTCVLKINHRASTKKWLQNVNSQKNH